MRTQLGPMSSCVEFGCAVLNRIFKMTVSLQIGDLKMGFIAVLSQLRLLRGTRRGRRQDGGGVTAAMLIFLIKCK